MLRTMLCEATQSMLTHSKKWSWLKAWGMRVPQRRGIPRATVAVATRLALVPHGICLDGTDFRWSNGSAAVVQVALRHPILDTDTPVPPRRDDTLTATVSGV